MAEADAGDSKWPQVIIHADGACSGNPGPGGWGAVLDCQEQDLHREISGGERHTTNNRMELTAVIQGLRALKMPCQVEVVTDSSYVANAFRQGWLERWRKNGWTIRDRSPVKNLDLWQELLQAMEPHRVRWTWIKGHAGNSGNELADHLAVVERDRFSHS